MKIQELQERLAKAWKPLMKDLDTMYTDATCYESEMRYPTDQKLLWEGIEKAYAIMCRMSERLGIHRPRTKYLDVEKANLSYRKQRRHSKSQTKKITRRLVDLLGKILREVRKMEQEHPKGDKLLTVRERNDLAIITKMSRQQKNHFRSGDARESIPDRIVSISKPYVRPIVRGKEARNVEFGAKSNNILVDGPSFIEKLSFNAFSEGTRQKHCITLHKRLFGVDVKKIGGDTGYAGTDNRDHCRANDIQTSFTKRVPRFVIPTAPIRPEDVPVFGRMVLRQKRYFALDFDDLLYYTLHILENFPEVRKKWQQQFQYIMVDEVQDCDKNEWRLFTLLSEGYGNLFIVGDADQAIYEWKGAHPELFVNYCPDKDIYLQNNFRSVPNIVCLAHSIIRNNRNRLPRTSVTMRPANRIRTVFCHCRNEQDEARKTALVLKNLNRKEGLAWKNMAILYRATYLSRAIEQTSIREKIPYVIWGGVRFFERKEIKDALGYLRLAALDDDMSFKRVANVPSRKIGKKTMDLLQRYAASKGCSLFRAFCESGIAAKSTEARKFMEKVLEARRQMGQRSISALLEMLLEGSGLLEMYRVDTEEERLENLQELLKSVRLYEEENRNEEDLGAVRYLQDIALYTNADYRKEDDKVRLMTVHQAKGLEFPLVWVYGLNEGVMPSHRTIRERGEAGLEEERRLMYVACTRAMDRLYFSDSEGFNVQNSQAKFPSRFIWEAHDEMGPLYDIEGAFDPSLWDGTKRLIRSLESPEPEPDLPFGIGARVHHPVFGDGTVIDDDPDAGTVTVRFMEFGTRRIAKDSNLLKEGEFSNF